MIAGEIEQIMRSGHDSHYDPFFKKWRNKRKKKKAKKRAKGKERLGPNMVGMHTLPGRVLPTGPRQELASPNQPASTTAALASPLPNPAEKAAKVANAALKQVGGVEGAQHSVKKVQTAVKAEMQNRQPQDYDIELGDPKNKKQDGNKTGSGGKLAAILIIGTIAIVGIAFGIAKMTPAQPALAAA